MKVLLVLPPSSSKIREVLETTSPPMGLAYLASSLELDGHEVRIVDSLAMEYDFVDVVREAKAFDPDLVGVSASTPTIYDAYKVVEMIKQELPNVKTVIGGPHVSFMAKESLEECPSLDIVVRGEGESTIRELAERLERGRDLRGVRGITYRDGEVIKEGEDRPFIKNIDAIPLPAYHLLPMDRYKMGDHSFGTILTSRGCPYRCIFCSSSKLMGKIWRARSVESVLDELRLLHDEYGVREIEFLDDTFTLHMKRAEAIADGIVRSGLDIGWGCSSRANTMNKRLAKALSRAGCHSIYIGVESATQRMLDFIKKGITIEQVLKAFKILKEVGLNTVATFILGIPGETKELIMRTIKFAKKLKPTFAQFTIFTPYPGTEAFDMALREGWLITRDWSKFDTLTPVMKLPGLSPKDLRMLLSRAYLSFYLNPSYIIETFRKRRFFIFGKAFRALIQYLSDKFS